MAAHCRTRIPTDEGAERPIFGRSRLAGLGLADVPMGDWVRRLHSGSGVSCPRFCT